MCLMPLEALGTAMNQTAPRACCESWQGWEGGSVAAQAPSVSWMWGSRINGAGLQVEFSKMGPGSEPTTGPGLGPKGSSGRTGGQKEGED